MNKQEAILAMQQGKKVRYKNFFPNEWMSMKDGMMVLEDGVIHGITCTPEEFWKYRTDSRWDNGYELFNELLTSN